MAFVFEREKTHAKESLPTCNKKICEFMYRNGCNSACMMIQMSSNIVCNNNHVENGNENDDVHRICKTPHPLEEIENSLPHKFILQQLEKEEDILSRRIDQKDTRHMSIQNEIYQLLALYFVVQGVVLSALFQSLQQPNNNTCDSWWSPFSFSALAFLVTLAALHHKFRVQLLIEEELLQEKEDCKILFNCIEKLRAEGAFFDLQRRPISTQDSTSTTLAKGLWCWSYWRGYRGVVTLILCAFSVIILFSCWFVLCSHLDSVTCKQ